MPVWLQVVPHSLGTKAGLCTEFHAERARYAMFVFVEGVCAVVQFNVVFVFIAICICVVTFIFRFVLVYYRA